MAWYSDRMPPLQLVCGISSLLDFHGSTVSVIIGKWKGLGTECGRHEAEDRVNSQRLNRGFMSHPKNVIIQLYL